MFPSKTLTFRQPPTLTCMVQALTAQAMPQYPHSQAPLKNRGRRNRLKPRPRIPGKSRSSRSGSVILSPPPPLLVCTPRKPVNRRTAPQKRKKKKNHSVLFLPPSPGRIGLL